MTTTVTALSLILASVALASWPRPESWRAKHYPAWFKQAMCIHSHEGAWNSIGYVNGRATYGGGMQFLLSTWHRAGGTASSVYDIAKQPPREQLYRARVIWKANGGSWREWGTAWRCT